MGWENQIHQRIERSTANATTGTSTGSTTNTNTDIKIDMNNNSSSETKERYYGDNRCFAGVRQTSFQNCTRRIFVVFLLCLFSSSPSVPVQLLPLSSSTTTTTISTIYAMIQNKVHSICSYSEFPFHVSAWTYPATSLSKRRSQSFQQQQQQQRKQQQQQPHKVIFTRLSEDCISAIASAQDQANDLKQIQVDPPCMLAGICYHNQQQQQQQDGKVGAIRLTLDEFHITYSKVQNVLEYLQSSSSSTSTSSSKARTPKLSDFKQDKVELPLTASLQQVLFDAGKISSTMGANEIDLHHIFLALLAYQEVDGEPQAATRSDDCEAMEILYHLDATLEGEDICFSLLQNLLKQQEEKDKDKGNKQVNSNSKKNAELSTGKTNTASPSEPVVSGTGAAMSEAKEKARSLLQECGIDLTLMAREGQLDKVHGRDAELQACFQTLVRRRKNNVCLMGEAGVGKTCIVEALAQVLVSDECPPFLEGHRIISLEVGALLAGTKFRGEFEERLRTIIEILTSSRTKSILFIDEIHNLVGAGGNADGNLDASNILKPYLARGQLQVIGATTITEYNRYIAKDAALERRFQPLLIREPSVDETVDILKAVLPFYRGHHRVEFTPESIEAAARLSDRYINDRFLPDKAIDVLDEAGAMATLTRNQTDFECPIVTDRSITDIISQWTNIPVGKLEMDEMDRLGKLEENLALRVKGQERAVRTVAKAIRRARTGIRNPRRPVASFLFCGPTGTGKTELCKALADTYYGSKRDLVRIDMSEYMEKSSITRLTGPPPGLVGYEEGGQLTEAVRRSPHSVVLLDELEKAHVDVLNLLLQVLEDGILTDGKGRTISFKNCVLIMTSNIGSSRILDMVQKNMNTRRKEKMLPEVSEICIDENVKDDDDVDVLNEAKKLQRLEYERETEQADYNRLSRVVKHELEKAMKPEFLNRIDDIVVFQPLTTNELSLIGTIMVLDILARAKLEKDLVLTVQPDLLEIMVEEGSVAASQFGARPMRRAVQRILEDAISDAVVQNFLIDGDIASLSGRKEVMGDPLIVQVVRERDNAVMEIQIDESSRDMSSLNEEDCDDDDNDDDVDNADNTNKTLQPNGVSDNQSPENESLPMS